MYALAGFQISPSAIIGFLTILAYSLYDTMVVFDKIRENTSPSDQSDANIRRGREPWCEPDARALDEDSVVGSCCRLQSILFIGVFGISEQRRCSDISLVDCHRHHRWRLLDDVRLSAAYADLRDREAEDQGTRPAVCCVAREAPPRSKIGTK